MLNRWINNEYTAHWGPIINSIDWQSRIIWKKQSSPWVVHARCFYSLREIGDKFPNVTLNVTLCAMIGWRKYYRENMKIQSSWIRFPKI